MYSIVIGLLKLIRNPRHLIYLDRGYVRSLSMEATQLASYVFKGNKDRYNGITVDSLVEPCSLTLFEKCLEASLDQWEKEGRRAIWFRVDISQSEWIPILVRNEFKFHHAKETYATLYRWLPKHQEPNIPPYAHTLLGVGAIVFNEDTGEVLVVKEKYSFVTPMWKFPGGYVEPGEDIAVAARREVLEETGIETDFKHLLAFRHCHKFAFGCSDLYMIVCMTPRSLDIHKCNRELTECIWMKLDEYLKHPEVHDNNRHMAQKFAEYRENNIGLKLQSTIHPVLKRTVDTFSISKIED